MNKYSCFVVSPIGEKGSEVRKLADDLYELLIEPALEKFGFFVTRADKISSVTSITSDIVESIQNADLCVIDITGHNPNVMYECGRRHETGKPYIMVAREGERLPFDITTIRTFFYNLEKPREILATKIAIQETVDKMLQTGFQSEGSGDSLASVVEMLRRIERKIDLIPSSQTSNNATGSPASTNATKLVKRLGVVDAFNYALSQEDPELIDSLIPIIKKRGPRDKKNYIIAGLAQGTSMGSRIAFDELEKELPLSDDYDEDDRLQAVGCYVSGACLLSLEERALAKLEQIYGPLSKISPPSSLRVEQRASILNQYQRLLHGVGRYAEARDIGTRVVELIPTNVSYLYNQSLNCSAMDDPGAASEMIDRMMDQIYRNPKREIDSDHLRQAAKVYARQHQTDKLLDVYKLLRNVDPYMAEVVEEMTEVAQAIKSV